MGDVIDLFTRQPIPAAANSEWVQEFVDNELGDLLLAIEELGRSEDEDEVRKGIADIRYIVDQWPL